MVSPMLLAVYVDWPGLALAALAIMFWIDAIRHYAIALRRMNRWLRATGQFAPPGPGPQSLLGAAFPRGEMPGVPNSVRDPYQHHARRFSIELVLGGLLIALAVFIPA
jgi:hypothetical protein